MALALGCTVRELRARMGSSEFSHWMALFAAEEFGPTAERNQWALLMAATMNGPIVRTDKKRWSAADFLPRPWGAAQARRPAATGASARAHLARLKAAKG